MTPRVNPQWGTNLDHAISGIKKLLSLFIVGSEGYNRLNIFLQTFKIANNLKFEDADLDNRYYHFLVFVYDINLPNQNPIIYSSIHRALKGLQVSYSNLFDHIENKYIYKSQFILSFEPIALENFVNYTEKPASDNQLRKHIILYNLDNEIVAEFKSSREMAKYFQIDGKVARAAIAKGEYQDFVLIVKSVSFRKAIYVYDSNTHELLQILKSMASALKYAKVNFYTLKSLIETGKPHQGKIYSYNDKL